MSSLSSHTSQVCGLPVQRETLSQKIRWEVFEESTHYQPLAFIQAHVCAHACSCISGIYNEFETSLTLSYVCPSPRKPVFLDANFKKVWLWRWWLRVSIALAWNQNEVPSTHIGQLTTAYNSTFREPETFF